MDDEEQEIMKEIIKILNETKDKILVDAFKGYDSACFDLNIDLKVMVDDNTVGVKESWKAVQI